VGIYIQPNAVRELSELGFGPEALGAIGVQTQELSLVGLNGNEVYSEMAWFKGRVQVAPILRAPRWTTNVAVRAALERLGRASIRTGLKVTGYRNQSNGTGSHCVLKAATGTCSEVDGSLLIAADGLHSAVRQQMYPEQPPDSVGRRDHVARRHKGKPIRSGASFVGLGTHRHRVVFYPISAPDPLTGLADINWIAEITVDNSGRLA
jgi:2-polyprenyl-6-methoxyphenol hydroxylase-like FAD-dependent oxidoreductase